MACAAMLAGVLAGCSESTEKGDATSASKASSKASASASAAGGVESGGSVGAAGSACELPVGFDIAEKWKAEAVDNAPSGTGQAEDELADLVLTQGPVSLVCEIDAKPAGNIGFLRAWTGKPGGADARTVLEEYVADEPGAKVSKERFSTFKAGDLAGVEVKYLTTVEFLDETKENSALAVVTPDGPVVLHLGGLDSDEHQGMLPAFELAKKTLHTV
ncbi:lipoprotein [Streptomyces sp. S.PB5]|uniref:lipoprotein n=1 Tax=Streptomyces sp. S.PB5 TaxID=3020844 RepID=UPI0025AF34E5|nr:lipoprotein [Streptomyces sp. S.PB5]MDN3029105.1 lipoprotein [Streptomyces sp. S.PB5]